MSNQTDNIEAGTLEKEKSSQKEKAKKPREIVPKYYLGTDVRKLPKVPKGYIKDLEKIDALTTEQLEKYLTAVVLGLIPDRFGLDVSADTKMKAAKGLLDIREIRLREQAIQSEEDLSNTAIEFVLKQKQQVDNDLQPLEDEETEDDEYGSN